MWLLLLIILGCLGIIFAKGLLNKKRRLEWLKGNGRILAWEGVKKDFEFYDQIIQINFGFGKEFWALKSGSAQTDHQHKVFKNGMLIFPAPHLLKLKCHVVLVVKNIRK
jgi:hypothetical protein